MIKFYFEFDNQDYFPPTFFYIFAIYISQRIGYKMRNFIFIVLLLSLILTSCVTTRELHYLQSPQKFSSTIASYKDTVAYQDYKLQVGDKLYLQVYSTDDKTNALFNGGAMTGGASQIMFSNSDNMDLFAYIVDNDGKINLPILGDLYVQGKTLRETKFYLEDTLKSVLPLNSVDIRLLSKYFSVIGGGKSGRFTLLKEKVNVFQALAMSGDFGLYVDRSKIRIIRQTSKGTVVKMFDIRSADILHSEFYYIEPNDVIYLEPLNAQFFGINNFWTFVSTGVTTFSFVLFVYKIITPN
jgi:polysaccharide biosynthesis/export protein